MSNQDEPIEISDDDEDVKVVDDPDDPDITFIGTGRRVFDIDSEDEVPQPATAPQSTNVNLNYCLCG